MTKPKIPKEIPKERPERISPGIPVVPKREPDYPHEPMEVPEPERPEKVPAYMPHNMQDYLSTLDYKPYREGRGRQIY